MVRLIELRQLGDGVFGSVLSEKLLISHGLVVELVVIVFGIVKKLSVGRIQLVVVFGKFYVEVGDPSELPVYIALLRHL